MNKSYNQVKTDTARLLQQSKSYLEHLHRNAIAYKRENDEAKRWLEQQKVKCQQLIDRCPNIKFPA